MQFLINTQKVVALLLPLSAIIVFLGACSTSPAAPSAEVQVATAIAGTLAADPMPTAAVLAQVSTATLTPSPLPPTAEPKSTFTPIPSVTPISGNDETVIGEEGEGGQNNVIITATATETQPVVIVTATPTGTPALPDLPPVLAPPTGSISRTVRVPILMYHYVSTPPEDADNYRINLSVEPDVFRAQMVYLAENGYTTIDLYDLIEALVNKEDLPPKSVILTFDDGYRDNYEYAFPILEEFGFKGTFFIPTEFIDFEYDAYMTWPMIEEMAAAGHRMESHTKNHPDLANLGRRDLVWQILGSQETLAAHIGYKPQFLSYPGGSYNSQTLELVEELSLWGAVTTQGGMWHSFANRYEWQRTRISYFTSIADIEKVLIPRQPSPTPQPTQETGEEDDS